MNAAATPADVDVLMITHARPAYTERSLARLLESCDDHARVWVWQNGNDPETLAVVRAFQGHPRLYRFHHSEQNRKLLEPTNWLWREAPGALLGKVDDDCAVPLGWIETFRAAHADNAELGGIACWHFPEDDFDAELCAPKIRDLVGDRQLLQNMWLPGSGYLMKRACIESGGLLADGQTFTNYCVALALRGWIHGFHLPLLLQDHMDDPRSDHTLLRTDEDFRRFAPLSARANGVDTVRAWDAQLRRSARLVQSASIDPRDYSGPRKWWKRVKGRITRGLTGRWY